MILKASYFFVLISFYDITAIKYDITAIKYDITAIKYDIKNPLQPLYNNQVLFFSFPV